MLLYEMPRAVLRGACLQYTMTPRSGLDKTAFTAVLHGSMFSSPVRESASAHEERAAAQAAGLRLLYHISGCMLCFLFIFVRKQQPYAVVGAAAAGRGKGRCGAAKPWPRSGRPPRECAAKCRARFCAANPKGGADDRRAVSRSEMRPNGSKGRSGNGSRVWEKRKAPAFAGPITSLRRPTFLALRK